MTICKSIPVQRIDINGSAIEFRSILHASRETGINYYQIKKNLNGGSRLNGYKFYQLVKPSYHFVPPLLDNTIEKIREIKSAAGHIQHVMRKTGSWEKNTSLVQDLKALDIICQRLIRRYKRHKNA